VENLSFQHFQQVFNNKLHKEIRHNDEHSTIHHFHFNIGCRALCVLRVFYTADFFVVFWCSVSAGDDYRLVEVCSYIFQYFYQFCVDENFITPVVFLREFLCFEVFAYLSILCRLTPRFPLILTCCSSSSSSVESVENSFF
jgi:hypothetical protein